jgi:trehalose 6-phosphate synthase
LNERVCGLIEKINRRWARGAWKPIVFIHRHLDQRSLIALQIMADFCLVSALHDGMNLVAKEFVASRTDQDGVLILSAFAGAAQELTDALIVNPFATEEIAGAIHRAIEMPKAERRRRMASMRAVVAVNNIYRWATGIVLELSTIRKHADEQGAYEDTAGNAVNTEVA